MFKAIFYKEWIKSRHLVMLLVAIAVALVLYSVLSTAHAFRNQGDVSVWFLVVQKDMPLVSSIIGWFFIATAISISVLQYTSEMVNKRFKLTLHLPKSENKIMSALLAYGIITLLSIYTFTTVSLIGALSYFYPCEMIVGYLLHLAPYILVSFAGYFLVVWIVVEPIWKIRVANTIVSIAVLSAFTLDAKTGAYIYSMPYLLFIVMISFLCAFYSASRFKDGAQK